MPGYHPVLELHLLDRNRASNVLVSRQLFSADGKKILVLHHQLESAFFPENGGYCNL